MIHKSSIPLIIRRASTRVAAAIAMSATMASSFRFIRSASTPSEQRDDALRSEGGDRVERDGKTRPGPQGDVPHDRVLNDHRPEQGDGLSAEEQRHIALPGAWLHGGVGRGSGDGVGHEGWKR